MFVRPICAQAFTRNLASAICCMVVLPARAELVAPGAASTGPEPPNCVPNGFTLRTRTMKFLLSSCPFDPHVAARRKAPRRGIEAAALQFLQMPDRRHAHHLDRACPGHQSAPLRKRP